MKTTKAHVLCNIIINFQNQKSLFFLSCWGDIYLCLSVRLCEKQQYFGMSTMFGGFFLNQRFTREAPMCWHQNMATWSFSLWLSRLGLCFFVFLNVFFTLGNQPEFLFFVGPLFANQIAWQQKSKSTQFQTGKQGFRLEKALVSVSVIT